MSVTEPSIAELSERLRIGFGGFNATHHAITNNRIAVEGDRAHIRAHIHAQHWVPAGLVDPQLGDRWVVIGFCDDDAVRPAESWRLERVKLTLRHQSGPHVAQAGVAEGRRLAASR